MADSPTTPKRVILVPGHPVSQSYWRALSEHFDLCFIYPQSAEYAASIGVPGFGLNALQNGDTQEKALNVSSRITAKVVNDVRAIEGRLLSRFNGNAPRELQNARDWWGGYVLQHAQALAMRQALLNHLSTQREIAGCVVHEDVAPDTRGLVLWCRANGIPTIHIPHAACHLRIDGGPDIHRESRCDWILASGAYERDFYATGGHPLDRIAIIGAPQFDSLYADEVMPSREEARRVLDIDNERVICYAGTWAQTTAVRGGGDAENDTGFQAVLRLAHEWEAVVIVKSHPNGGDDKMFERALRATNTPGLITKQYLSYALRAADVVIAQGPSNICVEAAILGTPSAYIQTDGFDYAHALPFRACADQIGGAAHQALDSRDAQDWQGFVEMYNAVHPAGGAGESAVEKVLELCR